MRKGPSQDILPTGPLIAVCGTIALAVAPLCSHLPGWSSVLLGAALLYRLISHIGDFPLHSRAIKGITFLIATTAIFAEYGSIGRIEQGLVIVLSLIALKVVETNSSRDFQVLGLLGMFMSLCALFYTQDLAACLYAGFVVAMAAFSIVWMHSEETMSRAIRTTLAILVQSIPLIVILFIVFPRFSGGLRFQIGPIGEGKMGMSDSLNPGAFSSLAASDDLVFRAEFPEGNMPPPQDLYWRGMTLGICRGLQWNRYAEDRRDGDTEVVKDGNSCLQRIIMEPERMGWLFALDQPGGRVNGARYIRGNCLMSTGQITVPTQFNIRSWPHGILKDRPKAEDIQVPDGISPLVHELVTHLVKGAKTHREIALHILNYFRTQPFTYTLSPGYYGADGLEDFLLRRRVGFCEHYSAAYATLVRLAGVPARIVVGYHGGSLDAKLATISQSDAHAWCEVYLDETGWTRIDPTEAVAPDRIALGLQDYLDQQTSTSFFSARRKLPGWKWAYTRTRVFWNKVSYEWDLRILNYNQEAQRSFFAKIGISNWKFGRIAGFLSGIIAALLLLLAIVMKRPESPLPDAASRWFHRFCRKLSLAGLDRGRTEGPLDYVNRASVAFPEQAELILRIGQIYAHVRYGSEPQRLKELADAISQLPPRLKKLKDTNTAQTVRSATDVL